MEAHRFGTVSSASLMVNTLGFLEAVSLAKSTPSLGVGLHFNLTYGTPATNPLLVPSLVGTGGSCSTKNFLCGCPPIAETRP
ncbi:ChbG/HpnK family deacetylase [Paenibacillus thiaminolyticus]|nr:ChbG/HpnK family deacetylase [Paenibacillus thiaminolyticus]WCF09690.1 ChbG/HpnK family deacetylase [Paenibacillus thiaminolyticus]